MIAELHTAISNTPRRQKIDQKLTSADRVKIRVERMTLLLRGAPVAIAVSVLTALITLWVAWGSANRLVILGWTAAVVVLSAIRFAIWLRYARPSSGAQGLTTFTRLHYVGMGLNGVLWGALAPIFAVYGLLTSAFLPFMIAGMTAATIVSAGSSWRAVLAFNVPALIPFAVVYFVAGGAQGPAIAALVCIYAGATAFLAWRMQEVLVRSIRLRSRNDRLLDALKKQVDAAHEAEKRYRALVESSADLTVIFSPEGRIVYASPSVATTLGWQPRALIGKTTKDIVHPDDMQHFRAVGGKALSKLGEVIPLPHLCLQAESGDFVPFAGRLTNMLYVPGVEGFVFNGGKLAMQRNPHRMHAAE
jgi:PAS domain S-box-containing protein